MSPRLYVTAALLPLAGLAVVLAPILSGATSSPSTASATSPAPATSSGAATAAPSTAALPTPANPQAGPAAPTPPGGSGPVHFTATVDRDVVYQEDRELRVKVELWADPSAHARAVPTDLIVVLDRSGSMEGDKILDAKAAAQELYEQVGPQDRFALVTFASDVRVDLPLEGPTSHGATTIRGLQAGGGTAMVDGLAAGLDLVVSRPTPGRARRVVLISDGLPDTPVGLDDLARRAARSETPLSTIGIGADYDEALMQRVADLGTGNFHWATRGPELQQQLAAELSTARETVASSVRLSLGGQARLVDAGGLPIVKDSVAIGSLFAGQRRTLWLTVAVPPGAAAGATVDLGGLTAAWTTPSGAADHRLADLPAVGVTHDPRVAYSRLGDDWADSVVDEEYNELRTAITLSVKQGDQAAALREIAQYKQKIALMNGYAANPKVAENLVEVNQLEAEVNDNFTGADQAQKQNTWSKSTLVDATTKRRAGAKMAPQPSPSSKP